MEKKKINNNVEKKVEVKKEEAEVKFVKKTDYIFAIFLIFVGFVLLLNTTGLIEWSVWSILWRFWPLIIVFAGLNLIFEGSKWFSIFLGILSFVILSFIFLWSVTVLNVQNVSNSLDIPVPNWFNRVIEQGADVSGSFVVSGDESDSFEKKNIEIEMGVGDLKIINENIADHLLLDAEYFDNFGEPVLKSDFDENLLNINLDLGKQGRVFAIGNRSPLYSLTLGTDELPTGLMLKLGAGKSDLFLEKYMLENFFVELGAGEMKAKLSEMNLNEVGIQVGAGNFVLELGKDISISKVMNLNVGAGKMTLILPEGIEYKINGSLGIGSIKTPQKSVSGFGNELGEIKTEGYDLAEEKIDIVVEVGVGELLVK